jgi:hypothetical protein
MFQRVVQVLIITKLCLGMSAISAIDTSNILMERIDKQSLAKLKHL